MGVKYLTAYAESLGPPVVSDTHVPVFADCDDGTVSNAVVLDASGGLARYAKPDESDRSVYDFQDLFERVAVDMAALRALGYDPIVFLDAAVPSAKLPVWKTRRRAELVRQGKIALGIESPPFGQLGPPPPLPKNNWVPPEGATQFLADAYAAAGCEVHLGVRDVDLEAAAYAKKIKAFAVLTCDSDFYLMVPGRVWHYERFDVDHALWRRRGDPAWWGEGGEGEEGEEEVWLPPAGSPGVRSETQRRRRWRLWPWLWPFRRRARSSSSSSSSPPPPLLPRIPVREIRTDLLRERLQLSPRAMPLLAACLGNDSIPHVSRRQLEAVFAEHPDLPPPPPGSALVAAALLADAAGGGGGGAVGAIGGGGSGGSASALPPGSLLAPDGPGRGAPWRVVEILAHELSRQVAAGVISVGRGGSGSGGEGDGKDGGADDDEAAVAAAAASASARAAASNPRRAATARFVAHRATVYARAVREAYDPASVAVVASSAAPSSAAATAAAALTPDNTTPNTTTNLRPAGSFRSGGMAPNVVRAVIAHTGAVVRGMRADDAREPAAVVALRELRLRAYAGCGLARVRELLYHPIAVRPYAGPAVEAVAGAVTGAAAAAPEAGEAGAAGGDSEARSAPAAPPLTTSNNNNNAIEGPLGAPGRTGGFIWQEDFTDVDVAAELAALGTPQQPPPPPLLPSSPEVARATKSGRDFAAFAARELLRLELITPVEAELVQRQACPGERARLRRQARACLLGSPGDGWSGNGGVIACMRSARVCSLLLTVHTWVAVVLDNVGIPTVESFLDVRVFNELWRREVGRLEKEEQPRGAAQRRRWVREGGPPPLMMLGGGSSSSEQAGGEGAGGGLWYWLPQHGVNGGPLATGRGVGGGGSGSGGGEEAAAAAV